MVIYIIQGICRISVKEKITRKKKNEVSSDNVVNDFKYCAEPIIALNLLLKSMASQPDNIQKTFILYMLKSLKKNGQAEDIATAFGLMQKQIVMRSKIVYTIFKCQDLNDG